MPEENFTHAVKAYRINKLEAGEIIFLSGSTTPMEILSDVMVKILPEHVDDQVKDIPDNT